MVGGSNPPPATTKNYQGGKVMSEFKNCFTIAIDADDTIENLLVAWISELNKRHNLNASIDDVKGWEMGELYPTLTSEQIFSPLFDEEFWYSVTPKADAIKYVEQLIKDGHDVYIVTSSHYGTIKAKFEAIIARYFPSIDWKHFITTNNKKLVKCDIMIDDGPHNLEDNDCIRILFDAPHNKKYPAEENQMKRVHNWEEAYNLIKNLDWFYSIFGLEAIQY